ncbi:MAG TPA: LysM peptidoglycan-binding domain-containing protein [Kineosporiaceae bacterium]
MSERNRCDGRWRARAGLVAVALAWWLALRASLEAVGQALPLVRLQATAPMDPLPAAGPPLDAALAGLAGLAGLVLLGWVGLAATCTILAEVLPAGSAITRRAHQLSDRVTPVAVRRLLALLIGAALVSTAAPAQAATGPANPVASTAVTSGERTPSRATSPPSADEAGWFTPASERFARVGPAPTAPGAALDPAWGAPASARIPPRPATGRSATSLVRPPLPDLDPGWGPPGRTRSSVHPQEAVVVRRGDTLWDLAARYLGPSATDAEIAQAWPRWFTANRSVIGPDPNRLRPGQRLVPPDVTPGGAT